MFSKNNLTYQELLNETDFEYFFRFKKNEKNFNDLWRMKTTTRESVKEWLISINSNPGKAELIANACSELVENTIKYSQMETFSFVFIHASGSVINIETINKADEKKREEMEEFMDLISTKDKSIGEVYVEKLSASISSGKSQLGILKILMETAGEAKLIKLEGEEDVIHIMVSMDLGS